MSRTTAAGRFGRGDVVRRSRRGELVAWVQAVRVVGDDERGLLLWLPEGSGFGRRVDDHGRAVREEPIEIVASRHVVAGTWQDSSVPILNPPAAAHSVWWFFRAGRFAGWYVDLEICGPRWSEGERRGFDLTDLGLDGVVDPDRTWRWKDEEDFAAFTGEPGYWTAEQAAPAGLGRPTR